MIIKGGEGPGVMVLSFNPSTPEARQANLCDSKVSMVSQGYRVKLCDDVFSPCALWKETHPFGQSG